MLSGKQEINFIYTSASTVRAKSEYLLDALKEVEKNPGITELDLSSLSLDLKQMQQVVFRLKGNQSLRTLNLGYNAIPLPSVEALLRILPTTRISAIILSTDPTYPNGIYRQRIRKIKHQLKRNDYKNLQVDKEARDNPQNSSSLAPDKDENSNLLTTLTATMSSGITKTVEWFRLDATKSRTLSITAKQITVLQTTVEKTESKVQALDNRVKEHDEKFAEYEKQNKPALTYLRKNLESLSDVIIREEANQTQDRVRKNILSDENLRDYYLAVLRHMTGTWLGCMTISSGCVANGMTFNSDYVAKALDGIGGCIPVVNIATRIISGVIQANNAIDKNKLVANMAQFFDDFETAIQVIKKLALALTEKQKKTIHHAKLQNQTGIKSTAKKWINEAKNWALSDGSNNPSIVLALADCGQIIEVIMKAAIKKTENIDELLKIVLNDNLDMKIDNPPIQQRLKVLPVTTEPPVSVATSRRTSSFSKFKEDMLKRIAEANARAERAEQKSDQAERRAKQAEQKSEQSEYAARNALAKAKKLEEQQNQTTGDTQMLMQMPRSRPRANTLFGDENIFLLEPRLNQLASDVAVTKEWMQNIQFEMTTFNPKQRGK